MFARNGFKFLIVFGSQAISKTVQNWTDQNLKSQRLIKVSMIVLGNAVLGGYGRTVPVNFKTGQ